MEQTYYIRDPDTGVFAAAIADIVTMPVDENGRDYHVITRINVMEQYRGRGYGTKILEMILEDADKESITLVLEPVPSGPLDAKQLRDWYTRYGFVETGFYLKRDPK